MKGVATDISDGSELASLYISGLSPINSSQVNRPKCSQVSAKDLTLQQVMSPVDAYFPENFVFNYPFGK